MKKWWLGACGLALALVLGGVVFVLDHARAAVRISAGLEGLSGADEEQRLVADGSVEGEPSSAGREPATPSRSAHTQELEVHVVREDGEPIVLAEVLVYRGKELLRADYTERGGVATLVSLSGSASVRVRLAAQEIARRELTQGRGRVEIVVPMGASVAGVVRVDGAPRRIDLELVDGAEESWSERLVREGLERAGWRERWYARSTISQPDGSFRFAFLRPDWSGVLRLASSESARFADGSKRLALVV